MNNSDSAAQLADLLMETGQRHHQAFIETDGVDPEWPLWYAAHLSGHIDHYLNAAPTKSKIVQCLMNASEAHAAAGADTPWPTFYANYILGLGPTGMSTAHAPS